MPFKSGTIEAVSIKAMPAPDKYANTFRASFKIEEEWYSYGAIKKETINVKNKDEWIQLSKGMEIEFQFDENGDFKNVKKTTLGVLNIEGAQAVPTPSAPPQQQRATSQPAQAKGSFVNPAEVGQCLNLAVDVLGYQQDDLLVASKVTEAIKWYKEVRELFTELYPTVTTAPPVKKEAPKQDARPTPPPLDLSDDDPI